jgi:phage terminase large subunit
LGERAVSRSTVYRFQTIRDIPSTAKHLAFGLDFGYSNDPTAMVQVFKDADNLYLREVLYETGLTNQDIGNRLRQMDFTRADVIYADSAEPKSIEELHRMGFNVKPANKGKDSLAYGIDLLRRHILYWEETSNNGIREMRSYKYIEDKNGNLTNTPIDENNHLLDAIRYGVASTLSRPNYGKYSIR